MRFRILIASAAALAVLASVSAADESKHEGAPAPPNAGFEKLKALVGTWQTKDEQGKPATISYALVSGGSVLEERLGPAKEPNMVTMYHADGEAVLMTHYCAEHNQPRMRASAPAADAKTMEFDFVDCTNLSAPDAGHMHHLTVTFLDKNHFDQEWTWAEKGKDAKVVFHFERKKA